MTKTKKNLLKRQNKHNKSSLKLTSRYNKHTHKLYKNLKHTKHVANGMKNINNINNIKNINTSGKAKYTKLNTYNHGNSHGNRHGNSHAHAKYAKYDNIIGKRTQRGGFLSYFKHIMNMYKFNKLDKNIKASKKSILKIIGSYKKESEVIKTITDDKKLLSTQFVTNHRKLTIFDQLSKTPNMTVQNKSHAERDIEFAKSKEKELQNKLDRIDKDITKKIPTYLKYSKNFKKEADKFLSIVNDFSNNNSGFHQKVKNMTTEYESLISKNKDTLGKEDKTLIKEYKSNLKDYKKVSEFTSETINDNKKIIDEINILLNDVEHYQSQLTDLSKQKDKKIGDLIEWTKKYNELFKLISDVTTLIKSTIKHFEEIKEEASIIASHAKSVHTIITKMKNTSSIPSSSVVTEFIRNLDFYIKVFTLSGVTIGKIRDALIHEKLFTDMDISTSQVKISIELLFEPINNYITSFDSIEQAGGAGALVPGTGIIDTYFIPLVKSTNCKTDMNTIIDKWDTAATAATAATATDTSLTDSLSNSFFIYSCTLDEYKSRTVGKDTLGNSNIFSTIEKHPTSSFYIPRKANNAYSFDQSNLNFDSNDDYTSIVPKPPITPAVPTTILDFTSCFDDSLKVIYHIIIKKKIDDSSKEFTPYKYIFYYTKYEHLSINDKLCLNEDYSDLQIQKAFDHLYDSITKFYTQNPVKLIAIDNEYDHIQTEIFDKIGMTDNVYYCINNENITLSTKVTPSKVAPATTLTTKTSSGVLPLSGAITTTSSSGTLEPTKTSSGALPSSGSSSVTPPVPIIPLRTLITDISSKANTPGQFDKEIDIIKTSIDKIKKSFTTIMTDTKDFKVFYDSLPEISQKIIEMKFIEPKVIDTKVIEPTNLETTYSWVIEPLKINKSQFTGISDAKTLEEIMKTNKDLYPVFKQHTSVTIVDELITALMLNPKLLTNIDKKYKESLDKMSDDDFDKFLNEMYAKLLKYTNATDISEKFKIVLPLLRSYYGSSNTNKNALIDAFSGKHIIKTVTPATASTATKTGCPQTQAEKDTAFKKYIAADTKRSSYTIDKWIEKRCPQ